MGKTYDNWERLVRAVLLREHFRELSLLSSPSSCSSRSSSFSVRSISQLPDDYLDLTNEQSEWKSMLPLDKQEVVWKSASTLLICKGQSTQWLAVNYDAKNYGSSIDRFLPSQPEGLVFLPVEARELMISTADFPLTQLPYSDPCGSEVVVNSVLSLDIQGVINTRLLTPKTIYGAYLVCQLDDDSMGFESAKATIRFLGETYFDAERRRARTVNLHQPVNLREGMVACSSWQSNRSKTVEIGKFYVGDEGDDQEVEARMVETSSGWKTGLTIDGIKFRPLVSVRQGRHLEFVAMDIQSGYFQCLCALCKSRQSAANEVQRER